MKETQTKLEKETNIEDKIYVNYTTYSVQTKLTEGTVLIFSKSRREVPFNEQTPIEKLTIREFEEKYGIKIRGDEGREIK